MSIVGKSFVIACDVPDCDTRDIVDAASENEAASCARSLGWTVEDHWLRGQYAIRCPEHKEPA